MDLSLPRGDLGRAAWSWSIGGAIAVGLAWGVAQGSAASVARGRQLAQANCATCHTIAGARASPMPDAPPFPDLERRSAGRSLDEIIAKGVMSAHPPMPTFLGPGEATADLLDYVRSVQVPAPAKRPLD